MQDQTMEQGWKIKLASPQYRRGNLPSGNSIFSFPASQHTDCMNCVLLVQMSKTEIIK